MITGTMRFSIGGVNMNLVVGLEKALLIDTGNPGNISLEQVRAYTDLPPFATNLTDFANEQTYLCRKFVP